MQNINFQRGLATLLGEPFMPFNAVMHFLQPVLTCLPGLVLLPLLTYLAYLRLYAILQQLVDHRQLLLLLIHHVLRLLFDLVVVGCPCCLFDHAQKFNGLEIDDLCDLSLLYEEVRIINVE